MHVAQTHQYEAAQIQPNQTSDCPLHATNIYTRLNSWSADLEMDAAMPADQSYWEGNDNQSDSRLIADMTICASTTLKPANEA